MNRLSPIVVVVAALLGALVGAAPPTARTEPPPGVGEPWTQQEILDFIGHGGLTEVPVDQQAALADGIVTWAELEQAMEQVEACYEQQQPGHDLSFNKHEFDPDSGQPPTLTPQIVHGPEADDATISKVELACERQFALPLTWLHQEMHTDRAMYEQWLADHPPEPGGRLWVNGTPVPDTADR